VLWFLQVLSVLIASLALALAVAHALERPGKMRLERESYLTVQRIYYPGFTFGGISEPVAAILTVVLLFSPPRSSRRLSRELTLSLSKGDLALAAHAPTPLYPKVQIPLLAPA
jgi:hypothetical protein